MLINCLCEEERCARIECVGLQLDELWSFVGSKKYKRWVWLALNPVNRQIVAFHVGNRGMESARCLWEKIPRYFHANMGYFSDYWKAYQSVFDPDKHYPIGKQSGLTAYIERFNNTLRQRCSRLVRKALSFSKSEENHIGAIQYFISDYNQKILLK